MRENNCFPYTRRSSCICVRFCTLLTPWASQTRSSLDAQPPSQLLTPRSILRSFSSTDSSPAGGDVPRDTKRFTVLRVTARCCGLCVRATGFGAWTVMVGRAVGSGRGSVRDIAVPLSNTADRTAIAVGAIRPDDILIIRSLKSGKFRSSLQAPCHVFPKR
jgi:hypothetical protein